MTKELNIDEFCEQINDTIIRTWGGGGKYKTANLIIDICQQRQWIPIEERQPELGAYVDCTDGKIEVRTRYAGGNHFIALDNVTHWMERPELPKKSEGFAQVVRNDNGEIISESTLDIDKLRGMAVESKPINRNDVLDEVCIAFANTVSNMSDKEQRHQSIITPLFNAIEALKDK